MKNMSEKKNKINIERIKSTFIVVLSVTAILLLFLLWRNITVDKISRAIESINEEPVIQLYIEPEKLVEYIEPYKGEIKMNGDTYILYDNVTQVWDEFLAFMRNAAKTNGATVSDVLAEDWHEACLGNCIMFTFNFEVSAQDANEMIYKEAYEAFDNVLLTNIMYSLDEPNNIYFFNNKTDIYRRISFDNSDISFINYITSLYELGLPKYYSLEEFYGYGLDSNVFIPYAVSSNVQSYKVREEIEVDEKEIINSLAETFFGEGFDFVRRITETDFSVSYIYQYGQKTLEVSHTGQIVYKEVLGNNRIEDLTSTQQLLEVLSFVEAHGGWQSLKGIVIQPYIKSITPIEAENQMGNRFVFGVREDGHPIYYSNGEIITVDIIGNRVIYYERQIYEEIDSLQYISNSETSKVIAASDIINSNYKEIEKAYEELGKPYESTSEEEIHAEVVKDIKQIEIGYYKLDEASEEGEYLVVPTWVIETSEIIFFYNLKTGRLVDYVVKEVE